MNNQDSPSPPKTINTLGEVLEVLIRYEKQKIADFEDEGFHLKHGPTIGDIYEGLTEKVLNHALPGGLNLRVTNGFAVDKNGQQSGQLDCMLVKRPGKQIPNTNHEIVPIDEVLVVLEVKKTLYGSALPDIIEHFDQLMDLDPSTTDGIDAETIFKVFSQICGVSIDSFAEANSLPFHQQLVFHSLVSEHARPVRIAISYDGFKKEANFRKAYVELITEQVGSSWTPPTNWPDLIISGDFSMIKMNGRPYLTPSGGDTWQIYGTTRVSPVRLLLELIYTKIASSLANFVDFWGEDLESECINRFLEAKAVEEDGTRGWLWEHIVLNEEQLQDVDPILPWAPFIADKEEAIALHLLCNSPDGLEISEIIEGIGDRASSLVDRLKKTGLVAQQGTKIVLTTTHGIGGFLPDGRFFFGDDNTGRVTRWVVSQTDAHSGHTNEGEESTP